MKRVNIYMATIVNEGLRACAEADESVRERNITLPLLCYTPMVWSYGIYAQ